MNFSSLKSQDYALLSSKNFFGLKVKTALDIKSREKGLMGIQKLNDYNGILFIYEKPKMVNIWMKNTYIPLDIIFIDNFNKISAIREGIPRKLDFISSKKKVQAVLELPRNCSNKLKMSVGDEVTWIFKTSHEVKNFRYYHCLE